MATNGAISQPNASAQVLVRATVILRIPDLDTNELTALYKALQVIKDQFGGEFDVNTTQQPPQLTTR